MKFLQIPINKLIEWKWNKETREIQKDKFLQLIESLKESGSLSPIHVSISCPDQKEVPDYSILGGNHCLKAIQKIIKETGIHDYDSLWCVVHCPQDKDEALTISKKLNSHYANDSDNLFNIMDAFKVNWSNINLGFDSPRTIDEQFPATPNVIEDEPPAIDEKNIVCKTGDLWELGRHRLLCGDSTKREDVEKLMDGKKADMVFTDPPYGVNLNEKNLMLKGVGRGKDWGDLQNDVDVRELLPFLEKVFTQAKFALKDRAPWYIWYAQSNQTLFEKALESVALLIHEYIIWSKPRFVMGRKDYHWSHEPCIYGWIKGKRPEFVGGRNQKTVWEVMYDGNKAIPQFGKKEDYNQHPTQKPVELGYRAIKNHSVGMIYDCFLGSGSTLIACEQLNRICYGIEIEPLYCDVIIKRYIKFTGNNKLKRNGKDWVWKDLNLK